MHNEITINISLIKSGQLYKTVKLNAYPSSRRVGFVEINWKHLQTKMTNGFGEKSHACRVFSTVFAAFPSVTKLSSCRYPNIPVTNYWIS